MTDEIKINVPDIGGATSVDVIEILVKEGDEISVDTPLITLESEKASMEIPSSKAGKVVQINLKVGDKVSEGDVILTLSGDNTTQVKAESQSTEPQQPEAKADIMIPQASNKTVIGSLNVEVPDIGGATDVDVIDIMVKEGDAVEKDQSLLTLEGDKATMDIPSPAKGIIKSLALRIGDKVSQGTAILTMEVEQLSDEKPASQHRNEQSEKTESVVVKTEKSIDKPLQQLAEIENQDSSSALVSAGPAARRLARELGVNLTDVKGSGRKSRISKEDIQAYVKSRLSAKPAANGFVLPETPVIDFSKFGTIETKPLNKIKRLTGINVHRSWVTIPHVTQFDEADITDLEAFRKSESDAAVRAGYKLTTLAFVTKVVSKALMMYPQFNASLDASGENLIFKQYYNIGIAVETPNGLVVPVIKQVDTLSVGQIALEMGRLSQKARDKGLLPADMNGGCFTISSLGGIGGTAFTPIVNSPEVAILGLSRAVIKPVFENGEFKPRLMLPLSLSYDHRVIDGAEAARFTRTIAELLGDIRRILV